jgi:hypothetical protein
MTRSDGVIGKPYDQFLLFGDSITQMSCNQDLGFGFEPALQDGKSICSRTSDSLLIMSIVYCRKLDVLNRGFS